MAVLKQFKITDSKVFYGLGDSKRTAFRADRRVFPNGEAPAELNIEGAEFVAPSARPSKIPVTPEVAAAMETLKKHREAVKAEREARMTPEQREKREQKKAAKAQSKTAKAAPAPVPARKRA